MTTSGRRCAAAGPDPGRGCGGRGRGGPADRGAAAIEYAGLFGVVAVVVASVIGGVAAVSPQVTRGAWCAVRSILTLSGDCLGDLSGPGGPVTPPVRQLSLAPGYGNAAPRPAEPVDQAKVDRALQDILADLDGNWLSVRQGELADIQSILEWLDGAELDAVIAGMSDEQLSGWIGELNDATIGGGWDRARRQQLWDVVLAKASPATVARIAAHTSDVQPPFTMVGGDVARDDPTSAANRGSYGELIQTLFATGSGDANAISPNDAAQGQIGDCWYVASVMAIAQQRPDLIRNAIVANPNGTYTVTVYRDGKPLQITVTPDLPLVDGQPVFVSNGTYDGPSGTYEVWPMVLEKAAAQYYGTYGKLENNNPATAIQLLTGQPAQHVSPGDLPPITDLAAVMSAHGLITVSTAGNKRTPLYDPPASSGGIVMHHAYYIGAVDPAAGTVTVVNPWGPGIPPTTMSYQEFRDSFVEYQITSLGSAAGGGGAW